MNWSGSHLQGFIFGFEFVLSSLPLLNMLFKYRKSITHGYFCKDSWKWTFEAESAVYMELGCTKGSTVEWGFVAIGNSHLGEQSPGTPKAWLDANTSGKHRLTPATRPLSQDWAKGSGGLRQQSELRVILWREGTFWSFTSAWETGGG